MKPKSTKNIKAIIAGAGKAGELLSKNIFNSDDAPFEVVGFVDDDESKQGLSINGLKIIGRFKDIPKIVEELSVDEVIIALPSVRGDVIRKIVDNHANRRIKYRILPRINEVLAQPFEDDYLKYLRRVVAVDLVGDEIKKIDQEEIKKIVKPQTIMITGAAGSIGSELSRQIALYGAQRVIFYDWWENGMFELRNQIIENYSEARFEFIIGDIKDKKKLNYIIKKYQPDTIFHAAAYKHVPLMEANPSEAIKNNIIGTKIVGEAAIRNNVKKFVLVSSDKAVNPTNVMGATKRGAEKIIHILAESQSETIFCAVRFGNVANSNGSVMPLFERQIEKGGPLTVTHKNVTRYFMTIPEAVHLILKAWIMGENNDLFVLDMGEPIKIYDLARWIIAINGYIPETDIKIEVVGLRPGEKLYEELLVNEESTSSTVVEGIFKTKNYLSFDRLKFLNNLTYIEESLESEDFDGNDIKNHLKLMISTYHPSLNEISN